MPGHTAHTFRHTHAAAAVSRQQLASPPSIPVLSLSCLPRTRTPRDSIPSHMHRSTPRGWHPVGGNWVLPAAPRTMPPLSPLCAGGLDISPKPPKGF